MAQLPVNCNRLRRQKADPRPGRLETGELDRSIRWIRDNWRLKLGNPRSAAGILRKGKRWAVHSKENVLLFPSPLDESWWSSGSFVTAKRSGSHCRRRRRLRGSRAGVALQHRTPYADWMELPDRVTNYMINFLKNRIFSFSKYGRQLFPYFS